MFKNRKQDRDAELFYWKCPEKYFRHRKHQIQFSYQLPQEPQPSPSPSEINAKHFMAHIKEKARTWLDPLPTLYDNEINQFRSRKWNDDTRQIVEKIPIFALENSTKWDSSIMPPMENGRPANSNTITLTQDWTKLNRGCNKGNWRQPPHRRRITSFEAWVTDYEHFYIMLTFL